MLRSRFSTSFSLLHTSSLVASSSSLLLQQQRTLVYFSQQSEALENAARHKGYTSNVWHDSDDLWQLRNISKLKNAQPVTADNKSPSSTEHSVEFRGLRRIELFNADQLLSKPNDCFPEPDAHSSLRTKTAYSSKFQTDLGAIAARFNFGSRWWLSGREVSKRSLQVGNRKMYKPNPILINSRVTAFNAEQFEDPKRVAQEPVWAMSKKMMGRDLSAILLPVVQQRNYPTGLFVTSKQLEKFGLSGLIKPDEKPIEMSFPERNFGSANKAATYFNLTQIKDFERIAATLGRFPVDHPTYFESGTRVAYDALLQTFEAANFAQKGKESWGHYWLKEGDVTFRQWELNDTKGIEFEFKNGNFKKEHEPMLLYSVHQLTNPDALFKIAGTKIF